LWHSQKGFESEGEARSRADAAHGEQDARHERNAGQRVVADRQDFPFAAEQNFLMRD
jgi:hypothetical protein